MFTTAELDNYINEAATSYIKQNVPLDQTITKIASTHGLNRDQIARVVEGANTEVYVQLMNNSSDKYIQFENASAEKVAESVFGTEKTAEVVTFDYDEGPTALYKPQMVKVAEETKDEPQMTIAEFYKKADALAGLSAQYVNALEEVDIRFQSDSENLYNMVKQAYLGGTSFGDIKAALTSIADSPILGTILDECQEKLAQEIYPTTLNVERTVAGSVNTNNPLVKQASKIMHDTEEFIALRVKLSELHGEIDKLAFSLPGQQLHAGLTGVLNKLKGVRGAGEVAGKAVRGKGAFGSLSKGPVITKGVTEAAHSAPSVAPIAEQAANISKTGPATAGKGLSTLKKGLIVGGVGVAGGIGIEKTLEENRKRLAGMPMAFGGQH